MTESGWLIELDSKLTFAKRTCGGVPSTVTVTFTDPEAMRFKQQGDAEFEMAQLENRFPWMKGRLAAVEHMWVEPLSIPAAPAPRPAPPSGEPRARGWGNKAWEELYLTAWRALEPFNVKVSDVRKVTDALAAYAAPLGAEVERLKAEFAESQKRGNVTAQLLGIVEEEGGVLRNARAEQAEADLARMRQERDEARKQLAEIAKTLYLEEGEDEPGEYLLPAEPEPIGPYDIAGCVKQFYELMNRECTKLEAAESLLRQKEEEIARLRLSLQQSDCDNTNLRIERATLRHRILELTDESR